MHLGLKLLALCAPPLVLPVISKALHVKRHERPLSVKDGIMGEKWPVNFACNSNFHINRRDLLQAANLQRLYFPSEVRHAVDFFT
jgi:hypothetical protein